MEQNFVIIAHVTKQVSEDSWERHTKTLIVYPHTTIDEIDKWIIKNGLDIDAGYLIKRSDQALLGIPDYAKS
jgi:hypothetical protein